ncbi:MAG TPA: hypothetical protein VFT50_01140 [Baekduia sp.]|nr:hypothetical protein [Baekduia sp.]
MSRLPATASRRLLPLLIAFVLAPAGTALACGEYRHEGARAAKARGALVVGDSITYGAAGGLSRHGFEVDARACRFVPAGLAVLRWRARHHRLPRRVVVALGSNGTYSVHELMTTLRVIGRHRRLILVTPREARGLPEADARRIRWFAHRMPWRVRVVDWARRSHRHPSWFGPDGLHLTAHGYDAFARGIARAVRR